MKNNSKEIQTSKYESESDADELGVVQDIFSSDTADENPPNEGEPPASEGGKEGSGNGTNTATDAATSTDLKESKSDSTKSEKGVARTSAKKVLSRAKSPKLVRRRIPRRLKRAIVNVSRTCVAEVMIGAAINAAIKLTELKALPKKKEKPKKRQTVQIPDEPEEEMVKFFSI